MHREKNMNSELENAFNKELNIIKNDLYYQQLEIPRGKNTVLVRLDIAYSPMEILSGDSYSIRKNYDGKIVFFLVDAMGKGVCASLTATTTTSLLNFIFDQMQAEKNFDFSKWIQSYVEYIKKELLDNEMLSIIFGMYEKESSSCSYASFGMPAVIAKDFKNQLVKIKSNNMPISQYTQEFKVDTLNAKNIKKILIHTDGLCENKLENGEFYKKYMYEDFLNSECISDFSLHVKERLVENQDDMAYFYLDVVELNVEWKDISVLGKREEVDAVLTEIREALLQVKANAKDISEIILAMSEVLLNAVEHGIYGIDKKTKSKLIENGEFDDLLDKLEAQNKDKYINIKYFIKESRRGKMFICKVTDPGLGFDVRELRQLVVNPKGFNGRGIMIIKKLLDRFYYNEQGNSITLRKRISTL
jgi:anti-sigma regulatory factor (Ser/Thr protein kinase)